MDIQQYEMLAMRSADPCQGEQGLVIGALGLAGEAGEYADLIKKHVFHGHALDVDKAAKELGDVLWYVARAAYALGVPLDVIAQRNIEKLKLRYPDGFSHAASQARVDVKPSLGLC